MQQPEISIHPLIGRLQQFVQRIIKREFSKFEKYKDAIPHGGCVL